MCNVSGLEEMGEVTGKESSVLIENVSLIINVFNIGHGELGQSSAQGQGHGQQSDFLPNRLAECSQVPCLEDGLLDASGPRSPVDPRKQLPLGWIASYSGDVIPFGLQPIASEIPSFGEKETWKEIRVCLPPSLLADSESDLYCPVSSCREKLLKNKSMDSHIKKHLGIVTGSSPSPNDVNQGKQHPMLYYYCQDKSCQYNVESAEKWFKAYKNVKQHYIKVHAPRLFVCDMCQKTFSTLKIAETHKLMCGEKYSCSTCDASYNSLEALQTHCRRKGHVYDHLKYKDKRNFVTQELQQQSSKSVVPPAVTTGTIGGRKLKISRKLPVILPKVAAGSDKVFNTIQAFCQQAGVKVDYGCQTVCTAFLQKSDPVEAVIASPTSSFPQKKRKSTDTQTNIVKFRATCLDQRHNATNTNLDWKTVVTSDSQTQTAEISDSADLPCSKGTDTTQFNDDFATIKISEVVPKAEPEETGIVEELEDAKNESSGTSSYKEADKKPSITADESVKNNKVNRSTKSAIKVDNGPSLYSEFISFLEATDSSTQTDPDMFDFMGGDCLGIDVNLDNISGQEKNVYVSVSSTASQTAVESVSSKSLSAEDYEALLSATDDKKITDLQAFSDYIRTVEGLNNSEDSMNMGQGHNGNDLLFNWENIVEEVYRDVDRNQTKNSQL